MKARLPYIISFVALQTEQTHCGYCLKIETWGYVSKCLFAVLK